MRSQKQRKGAKAPKPRLVGPRNDLPWTHPPPRQNISLSQRRLHRFLCTTAYSNNITFQNLLDGILIAATATQGYHLFQAVRLVYVEMWKMPLSAVTSATEASTIIVEFDGTTGGWAGDQKIHEDTSMGISPAHLKAVPSNTSLAGKFAPSSSAVAFRLDVPAGTVIDVMLDYVGQYNAGVTVANALVGATAGGIYLRGLDGQPIASTVFNPQNTAAWNR